MYDTNPELVKAEAIANEWYTAEGETVLLDRIDGPVYYFTTSNGECYVDSTDWSHNTSA